MPNRRRRWRPPAKFMSRCAMPSRRPTSGMPPRWAGGGGAAGNHEKFQAHERAKSQVVCPHGKRPQRPGPGQIGFTDCIGGSARKISLWGVPAFLSAVRPPVGERGAERLGSIQISLRQGACTSQRYLKELLPQLVTTAKSLEGGGLLFPSGKEKIAREHQTFYPGSDK